MYGIVRRGWFAHVDGSCVLFNKDQVAMHIKCLLWIGTCVLVLTAGSGCVAPESLADAEQTGLERPQWLHSVWNPVYAPQVRAGATLEGAVSDLAEYLNAPESRGAYVDDRVRRPARWLSLRQCVATDRMLQIHAVDPQDKNRPVDVTLDFSDLPDQRIYVIQSQRQGLNYAICMHDLIEFYFPKPTHVRAIADALYVIQQRYRELDTERLAAFESKAAAYRALAVKPPISEEQRKLIVQANALNERKDYAGAIELYLKAIDLDPVSYPGAYFNLALLSAQVKRYDTAIRYMKQYLLLVPDAPDARSAQDKLYEWELLAKRHL